MCVCCTGAHLEVEVETDLAVHVRLATVGGVEREPARDVLVVGYGVERNVDPSLRARAIRITR